MKLLTISTTLLASTSLVTSLFVPVPSDLVDRRITPELLPRSIADLFSRNSENSHSDLEKRRGGGGGGGKGGGGGSSGNLIQTIILPCTDSEVKAAAALPRVAPDGPSAAVATTAEDQQQPTVPAVALPRGISPYPYILGGAALGFFPGLWLYGAYLYPYSNPYNFHNRTNNRNETLPVQCLCQQYNPCGCDDNNNQTYLDEVIGDGSDQNDSTARITNINGTRTLVLNGTLENGTDTADGNGATSFGIRQMVLEGSGFWFVGAVVGATVWLL